LFKNNLASPKAIQICNSHWLTYRPKIAKELAYSNAQTERQCSKNDEKNKQRNANKV